ncbi:hypothetical protein [Haloarchaeobius sp. FL176]|uniref:hypothetical protein n=1 Tax=Haloarchaeobius sp. FL176 TaxID=2967129 RepID=UPI0021473DC5|nr:hypothetical protein [Haloarchaeobius sp. FL176]
MGEDVVDGEDSGSVPVKLRQLVDGSRTIATLERVSSGLSNRAERLATTTRNSFLYRWLTKEPEPEVIVIDLRETYTVGPLIKVLDGVIDRLEPYWQGSRLRQALVAVDRGIDRAAETRTGEIVMDALAPPEPPDKADGSEELPDEDESDDDEGQDI